MAKLDTAVSGTIKQLNITSPGSILLVHTMCVYAFFDSVSLLPMVFTIFVDFTVGCLTLVNLSRATGSTRPIRPLDSPDAAEGNLEYFLFLSIGCPG
jgi:hypothetical protein